MDITGGQEQQNDIWQKQTKILTIVLFMCLFCFRTSSYPLDYFLTQNAEFILYGLLSGFFMGCVAWVNSYSEAKNEIDYNFKP